MNAEDAVNEFTGEEEEANEVVEGLRIDKLKEFADIYREREKIRAKDKELTSKLMELEPAYIEHMISFGTDKVSLKGGDSLELSDKIITTCVKIEGSDKVDRQRVGKALRKAGLGWLVGDSYNTNSLTAYVSELIKSGGKLPESLKGIVDASEITKLKVKKYQ
jgi:hypothetical protein